MVFVKKQYFDTIPSTSCEGCYFSVPNDSRLCPKQRYSGNLLCISQNPPVIYKKSYVIPMIKELLKENN